MLALYKGQLGLDTAEALTKWLEDYVETYIFPGPPGKPSCGGPMLGPGPQLGGGPRPGIIPPP